MTRTRIDELDTQIISALLQRARLSRQIQEQRLAQGEPRLDLNRELVVFRRYRGYFGAVMASEVLRYCRGSLDRLKGPAQATAEPRSPLPVTDAKGVMHG